MNDTMRELNGTKVAIEETGAEISSVETLVAGMSLEINRKVWLRENSQ